MLHGNINGNVLANDSDPESDPLTASLYSAPSNGTVTVQSNGDFSYVPNAGFVGSDSFSYSVSDGTNFASAQVNIGVHLSATAGSGISQSEGWNFNGSLGALKVDEPNPSAADYTVTTDWGDGTTNQANLVYIGNSTFDIQGAHTYVDDGNFAIEVDISDDLGNTIAMATAAQIANDAPDTDLGADQSASEGDGLSLVGYFNDAGSADTHTFLWEVTSSNGQQIANGTSQIFNFTPSDEGTYTVTFTVTDDDGAAGTDTLIYTVSNVEPNRSISGAATANELATYSLSLNVSDPGNDSVSQWRINWGDGTGIETISGNPSSVTHVYNTPGNHSIGAWVTDEDGEWAAAGKQVTVENVAPILNITHTMNYGRWVTLSGNVTDGEPGNLTLTVTGVVQATFTTNADGSFSYSVEATALGNYFASVKDPYDAESNIELRVLTSNAPVIANFTATRQSGNVWTFSGQVSDESPAGSIVEFGGIASLAGLTATVNADGTFSLTVALLEGEVGTATAQTADWWGLDSNIAQAFVDNSNS